MCACTKIRYSTRKDARYQLRLIKSRGTHGRGLRPYRCHCCGFFHLGHLVEPVLHGELSRTEFYG